MSKEERPGIELPMEAHWKQYWVMNCVCMLKMLPNDVEIKFKAMYKLSELAEDLFGWETGRLLIEIERCEEILEDNRSRITWWLDADKVHFDYNINPIHN